MVDLWWSYSISSNILLTSKYRFILRKRGKLNQKETGMDPLKTIKNSDWTDPVFNYIYISFYKKINGIQIDDLLFKRQST